MKWIEPTVFAKSCGNPDFRSIFGHQRAKNEGTNTKIDRGPETYPISKKPWDEMNRADSFRENCGNPDFRSIFGHQRAKNAGTNTKIDRGPETYPISINPRDEMNWANSFREKLRKPCLQTDGRTDGQTDGQTDGRTDRHQGESSIPPFHLRWSGGITILQVNRRPLSVHVTSVLLWIYMGPAFKELRPRNKTMNINIDTGD